MPKKPPKNAFFFYMLHYKQYEESRGRKFPGGMKEVADLVAPYWQKLSKEEKAPYEEKAKEDKMHQKLHGERYNSLGIPFSQLEREEEERRRKIQKQRDTVENLIQTSAKRGKLNTTNFFIISFNYFTKKLDGTYFPCEVGLVTFSIKDGIIEKFHSLIDPGKLPLGHAFVAKDHSERTHKLPLPPKAIGESDFVEILTALTDFLFKHSKDPNGNIFPCLVHESEQEMVQNILTQFCDAAKVDVEQYALLPITYFFEKLRNACEIYYNCKDSFPFTTAVATEHLERDLYQYHTGNGCARHDEEEINPHCALSRATRTAFVILDQTMDICGVKNKRAGFHYPIDCKLDEDEGVVRKQPDEEDEYGNEESDKENDIFEEIQENFEHKRENFMYDKEDFEETAVEKTEASFQEEVEQAGNISSKSDITITKLESGDETQVDDESDVESTFHATNPFLPDVKRYVQERTKAKVNDTTLSVASSSTWRPHIDTDEFDDTKSAISSTTYNLWRTNNDDMERESHNQSYKVVDRSNASEYGYRFEDEPKHNVSGNPFLPAPRRKVQGYANAQLNDSYASTASGKWRQPNDTYELDESTSYKHPANSFKRGHQQDFNKQPLRQPGNVRLGNEGYVSKVFSNHHPSRRSSQVNSTASSTDFLRKNFDDFKI